MIQRFPAPTTRLTFREFTKDDLPFLFSMLSNPLVMRHYPQVLDEAGAHKWMDGILARYERDGHSFWHVSETATGTPVGQVGLLLQETDGLKEKEIGYMLHCDHWGKGYASEAARAVRDFAFSVLDLPFVVSYIRPENEPSQFVARAMGMTISRRFLFKDIPHDRWFLERSPTDKM